MCGLCGALSFGSPVADLPIGAMVAALAHRGPDSQGIAQLGPLVLGHARLAVLDLTPRAHQPMQLGSLTIAYNGEVFNFPELRRELETSGATFHSHSDTEVILHAYAHWGTDAFRRLNGMFALALWDAKSERLILARDRFGIKPLYLAQSGDTLLFASEVKALLASRRLSPALNWDALSEYLWFGNALTPNTLFRGVTRLPPGYLLVADRHSTESRPYWRVEDIEPQRDSEVIATERVRTLLGASVTRHLLSDVPVGVFLSGGVDSSAITAFATGGAVSGGGTTRAMSSRTTASNLTTYSVDFEGGARTSELAKARRVAEHFGTTHRELCVGTTDLPEVLSQLVRSHDEPFGDAANIPLYLLCRELRGDVKVVLQGDGGDELFAGYRRYQVLSALPWLQGVSRIALQFDREGHRGAATERLRRMLFALASRDAGTRMALLLTVETEQHSPLRALQHDARERARRPNAFRRYNEMAARLTHQDAVQQMLLTDVSVQLPDTFLEKVDKPTMAHGIEARVPFLDTELTDYVLGLPSSLKVHRGTSKYILRKALHDVLPAWVLSAPKMGFDVPYRAWLRGPLLPFARERLLGHQSPALFDHGVVQQLLNEHASGKRDNGFLLWKLLQLALWLELYNVSCTE